MSRRTPSFTLESLVAWERRYHSVIAPTASRAGTWWLLWLGKLRWCTRKGKNQFWCSNDLCFLHSCSMCDLNVSAWMWDLRKLKLLCRVEALQDLLSWVTSSHIFWGLYIWESIESIEHCQTMSNPNSAIKCGTFISQLKNCSQGCAEGPTSCYQWGFMWAWWWVKLNRLDDVIWWCFDFHCRIFIEFVSSESKQFPHQLYLALQPHLKAWADSPKDLLHDITAHVRSGEVAQTCWVMGGADMAIKQLYFQWYVYNILIICLPHISIYYILVWPQFLAT